MPVTAELLLDAFVGRDDDELRADTVEGDGVAVQHVHERRAEVGPTAQAQDDHRPSGRVGHRGEGRLEHCGGGEEEAAVGLQDDDLAGGELLGRIGLDQVPLGVAFPAPDRHLVRLADDVQDHREPHAHQHRVLQRDEHGEPEGDDEDDLLHRPGSPHRLQVGGLDRPNADEDQQAGERRHGQVPDRRSEARRSPRPSRRRRSRRPGATAPRPPCSAPRPTPSRRRACPGTHLMPRWRRPGR